MCLAGDRMLDSPMPVILTGLVVQPHAEQKELRRSAVPRGSDLTVGSGLNSFHDASLLAANC